VREIDFAAVSAFRLVDPCESSTLPSTYFMFLLARYNTAQQDGDQLTLLHAVLLDREADGEDSITVGPEYVLLFDADLLSCVRQRLSTLKANSDADEIAALRNGVVNGGSVVCGIVLVVIFERREDAIEIHLPRRLNLPIADDVRELEEDWAAGLLRNLKQDRVSVRDLQLDWRARITKEFVRFKAGEPMKRKSNAPIQTHFKHRLSARY
jgi:hypothetical protein